MTNDRKIRMATTDDLRGQGHTIVGGRPSGKTNPRASIPRTLEVLMKKASLDADFCEQLIADRVDAARRLGLTLDPSEEAMLGAMPAEQLRIMIRHTPVPEPQKQVLKSGTTAALLALLAQLTFGGAPAVAQDLPASPPPPDGGSDFLMPPGGARPDMPEKLEVETGIRPDLPDVFVPVSRGISPDFPEGIRGIRPDVPIVEPVEPVPVKESPAISLEDLHAAPISTEVRDLRFQEAIDALQSETGVSIKLIGIESIRVDDAVTVSTNGLSLGRALRKLCQEAVGPNGLYQITTEGKEILIRFQRGVSELTPAPGVDRPHRPDAVTRGIRPDFPGLKKN